ncbi:MAG: MFS transporter [Caulobacteraceae bacterium]|nr:MFS transporter [Caulobacteraceae bacterium]
MNKVFTIDHAASVELDAHHIRPDDVEVAPGQIAMGVMIGRTSEYFDFFVYAIASALVFPQLFFPMVDRLTGALYSFSIFALAFVARPVGSVIFTAIDERYGRTVKLAIALFLLGTSTAAISFLPGYDQLGPTSIGLLALCRIGQGLALAGAWDGMASLLALNAPTNQRAWYAMMPQLGAPFGFLVAGGLFVYFTGGLSSSDFLSWGWRFPFFAAFAVNVVALFARLRLVATERYGDLYEQGQLKPVPVMEVLRHEGRNVIIGAFAPLATFVMFHLVTVFPLSWLNVFTNEHPTSFLSLEMIGAVVGVAGIVASGPIADRFGRRNHLALCAALIAGYALFAPRLVAGGPTGEAVFVILGFGLLGLSFGQASGAVSANFSRHFRYTGAAVTTDLSWMVGAGFAPLIALALSSQFGLPAVGFYIIVGSLGTLLALAINRRLQAEN